MADEPRTEGEPDLFVVRPPNPTDDPEFYCHGQACIEGGCTPLFCAHQEISTR